MKVKQITLGSSTLVLAALLTACGGSSSSGVQKPTPLVANTNNSGNHGATNPSNHGNHGNHGANNHGNHGNHGANNHGNHGNHGATNHGNHGNHGANNHGNHGNHGATNHGNHGNHGTTNHGNHGNHGATNHGNHGANNPAPKWDATVRYASVRNNAIKEAIDYVKNDADVIPKIDGHALTIDGRTQNGDIDLSKYPKGHHKFSTQERVTGSANGVQGSITTNSDVYLFKQDYSLIVGTHNKNMTVKLGNEHEVKFIGDIDYFVRGVPTEKLPTTGKFNYSGSGTVRAKGGVHEAKFSYDVDFGAKTGSGRLGNITLSEDKIKAVKHDDSLDDEPTFPGVKGKATAFAGILNGDYILGFYGPDAAEIVGSVELGDDIEHVGGVFGGTKQK